MYRLLAIFLCVHAATSAPQKADSDVTYVKIQPVLGDDLDSTNIRESRIEKLPLTIPGNISDKNVTESSDGLANTSEEHDLDKSTNIESPKSIENVDDTDSTTESNTKLALTEINSSTESDSSILPESLDLARFDKSTLEISTPDLIELSSDEAAVPSPDDLTQSDSENVSDSIPLETSPSDTHVRTFESAETTEAIEATERYEEINHTITETPRPKFIPKVPKLSYFQKPRVYQSYSSNYVENSGKRRFRSRCRCEKIWNCPKLQISVPRCPDEYFLCCF